MSGNGRSFAAATADRNIPDYMYMSVPALRHVSINQLMQTEKCGAHQSVVTNFENTLKLKGFYMKVLILVVIHIL